MSESSCDNMRGLISAFVEGRFDQLTAEQAEHATAHLDECASCAAQVAAALAEPRPPLESDTARPAPGDVDTQWAQISQALRQSQRAARPGWPARWLRTWTSLSAAAVVVLMVTAWQVWPRRSASPWELNLAGQNDIEIESVEVHGDTSLIFMNLGDDDGASIIWVTDEEDTTS